MINLIITGLCILCLLNICAYALPAARQRRLCRGSGVIRENNGIDPGPASSPNHGFKVMPLKYKQ